MIVFRVGICERWVGPEHPGGLEPHGKVERACLLLCEDGQEDPVWEEQALARHHLCQCLALRLQPPYLWAVSPAACSLPSLRQVFCSSSWSDKDTASSSRSSRPFLAIACGSGVGSAVGLRLSAGIPVPSGVFVCTAGVVVEVSRWEEHSVTGTATKASSSLWVPVSIGTRLWTHIKYCSSWGHCCIFVAKCFFLFSSLAKLVFLLFLIKIRCFQFS